jgi:hypothetical protein
MARLASGVVAALLWTMLAVAPASGDWHQFCERAELDWHRANAWPKPFIETDRLAACSPFVIMAQNGWIQQSTLTSYHFDLSNNQLTEAGRLKVLAILTEHPAAHRTIYYVPGLDVEDNEARRQSVTEVAQRFAANGSPIDVRMTQWEPRGAPADEVEAIAAKSKATIPDPRLPAVKKAGSAP